MLIHREHQPSFHPRHLVLTLVVFLNSITVSGFSIDAMAQPSKGSQVTAAQDFPSRQIIPLTEGWEIQPEGVQDWQAISLDDSWESRLGVDFDGIATYRIRLPELPAHNGLVLLRFQAAATQATVFLNGVEIGQHLGGWTPFQIDLTGQEISSGVLTVKVDERVGHNTQGFLPVFIPHFGGIWKPAEIILTPDRVTFDDLRLYAAGWSSHDTIEVSAPLIGKPTHDQTIRVGARIMRNNPQDAEDHEWVWSSDGHPQSDGTKQNAIASVPRNDKKAWPSQIDNAIVLQPKKVTRWSPAQPHLYRVEFVIQDLQTGQFLERMEKRAAIRHIAIDGAQLLLNGEAVQVRGVLNWGYAPPRLAPSLDEDWMRRELETIKASGFNLMKFCLWIPPQRYLELCDEMGILAWVEYPTWHPKLTDQYLRELIAEYDEFYAYDRNHPAVVLRSLTCETGPSAELAVIQQLYDQAHASVPYCTVEDDSSWIGWNRVHDFYDDHPYGNNHTWKETLNRLKNHIAERELKPLMLGEAIAADTWTRPPQLGPGDDPRWQTHQLQSLEEQANYLAHLAELVGAEAIQRLPQDALDTALRMRKFQIETFRQQLPGQGYVVSVIRDFPFAAMGLIDFGNQFKWPPEAWSWHGETILKLDTVKDRRSAWGGESLKCVLHALGGTPSTATLEFQWQDEAQPTYATTIQLTTKSSVSDESAYGFALRSSSDEFEIPVPRVNAPRAAWIIVNSGEGRIEVTNRWRVWVVPRPQPHDDPNTSRTWTVHSSIDVSADNFPAALPSMPRWDVDKHSPTSSAVVTRKLDEPLLAWLRAGGRVLLLMTGEVGAPPVADHWFLRGGVIVAEQSVLSKVDSDLIADLQTFDLAGPVMMAPDYLPETTPIALLWDNHDRSEYRTHALAWLAQVDAGQLLCSSLETSPMRGPATQYVVDLWMRLLEDNRSERAFSAENVERLRQDIVDVRIELPRDGWQFHPDREKVGESEQWYTKDYDRDDWTSIKIGTAWDGQGFSDLDGFGWYARRVKLPEDGRYLTFTGVDDSFDLWIDGKYVGQGGDRDTRVDAFSRFITLPIPESSRQQDSILIVVRVDDWQGAGGIFRPVFVSQTPLKNQSPILRRQQATTEAK